MSARVPIFGQPMKFALVEYGSTKGATIGTNVFNADGSLFAPAAAATPAADSYDGVVIWQRVLQIPLNVKALEAATGTGLFAVTGAGTGALRTLAPPVAGFTITNPAGIAGNPTFALADDLAAVEGLATTGIAVRTAANAWATRTLTGTADRLTVTNGDGVAGTPTFDLAATYVGQASITTLGTVSAGTWNATAVAVAYGGTGATTAAGARTNLDAEQAGVAATLDAALITATITNGDTTHAPSGDAVFDAQALKYDKTGGQINGDVELVGSARRIKADFTSAVSLRTFFTTSTVDGICNAGFAPNGTGAIGIVAAFSSSDVANSPAFQWRCEANKNIILATRTGTGALNPIHVQFDGFDSIVASTNGNVAVDTNTLFVDAVNNRIGVGTIAPVQKLEVLDSVNIREILRNTSETTGYSCSFDFTTGAAGSSLSSSNIVARLVASITQADPSPLIGTLGMVVNVGDSATTVAVAEAGGFRPGADNTFALGTAALRWATVYAENYQLGGTSLIIDSIADADSTHAPSRNAVFDALAGKADDSAVVHKAGTETVTGAKTFTADVVVQDAFLRFKSGGIGDGAAIHIEATAKTTGNYIYRFFNLTGAYGDTFRLYAYDYAGPIRERWDVRDDGSFKFFNNSGQVFEIDTGSKIKIAGSQVVGLREAGWSAPTGTATKTAFDTATVTTTQLAERVKALTDALIAHGLIGS